MCLTGGRDILPLLLLHLCQSPSSQPTILICHVQSLSKCCSFFNLSSANRSPTHFLRTYQLSEHLAIYNRTDAVYSSLVLKRVGGNFAQVKNPPVRCSISIEVASLPNLSFTMAITSNHTLSIFICPRLLQNRGACKDCRTNMMRLQKKMITSCIVINTRKEQVMCC